MSGSQIVAIWALFALAAFGLPGYFIGWAVGRAFLRDALDPTRLPAVDDPGVRVVDDRRPALSVAGRLPGEPLQWSEIKASQDRAERDIAAAADRTEAEIRHMADVAEALLPPRTRLFQ